MPHQPATDDDTRSSASRPAVDVDETARAELVVDLVERRTSQLPGRDGEVWIDHCRWRAGGWTRCVVALSSPSWVRSRTADSRPHELVDVGRGVLGPGRARVPAGDEPPVSMTVGGRTTRTVCRPPLPRPGGPSHRSFGGCRYRRRDLPRRTPRTSPRSCPRLAAEHDVDPGVVERASARGRSLRRRRSRSRRARARRTGSSSASPAGQISGRSGVGSPSVLWSGEAA